MKLRKMTNLLLGVEVEIVQPFLPLFLSLHFCPLDYEVMERGIFGHLQKVLNQPHGVSTGDQGLSGLLTCHSFQFFFFQGSVFLCENVVFGAVLC